VDGEAMATDYFFVHRSKIHLIDQEEMVEIARNAALNSHK